MLNSTSCLRPRFNHPRRPPVAYLPSTTSETFTRSAHPRNGNSFVLHRPHAFSFVAKGAQGGYRFTSRTQTIYHSGAPALSPASSPYPLHRFNTEGSRTISLEGTIDLKRDSKRPFVYELSRLSVAARVFAFHSPMEPRHDQDVLRFRFGHPKLDLISRTGRDFQMNASQHRAEAVNRIQLVDLTSTDRG